MYRREFLLASSMGAAGVAVARTGLAGDGLKSSRPLIRVVLYDPGYLIAREFANRHALRGISVFSTAECMVRLWRGPLAQSAGRSDACVAGLTQYSHFAMARDCARDQGLKVLHEEWSREAPSRTLISWLIGMA